MLMSKVTLITFITVTAIIAFGGSDSFAFRPGFQAHFRGVVRAGAKIAGRKQAPPQIPLVARRLSVPAPAPLKISRLKAGDFSTLGMGPFIKPGLTASSRGRIAPSLVFNSLHTQFLTPPGNPRSFGDQSNSSQDHFSVMLRKYKGLKDVNPVDLRFDALIAMENAFKFYKIEMPDLSCHAWEDEGTFENTYVGLWMRLGRMFERDRPELDEIRTRNKSSLLSALRDGVIPVPTLGPPEHFEVRALLEYFHSGFAPVTISPVTAQEIAEWKPHPLRANLGTSLTAMVNHDLQHAAMIATIYKFLNLSDLQKRQAFVQALESLPPESEDAIYYALREDSGPLMDGLQMRNEIYGRPFDVAFLDYALERTFDQPGLALIELMDGPDRDPSISGDQLKTLCGAIFELNMTSFMDKRKGQLFASLIPREEFKKTLDEFGAIILPDSTDLEEKESAIAIYSTDIILGIVRKMFLRCDFLFPRMSNINLNRVSKSKREATVNEGLSILHRQFEMAKALDGRKLSEVFFTEMRNLHNGLAQVIAHFRLYYK